MSSLGRCFCKQSDPPPKSLPPYTAVFLRRRTVKRSFKRNKQAQMLIQQLSGQKVLTQKDVKSNYSQTEQYKSLRKLSTWHDPPLCTVKKTPPVLLKTGQTFRKTSCSIDALIDESKETDLDIALMDPPKKGASVRSQSVIVPMEGFILKYTNCVRGYKYRWFVLRPERGFIDYYEKKEHKEGWPKGIIILKGAVVSISASDLQTFTIKEFSGQVFWLKAPHAEERQKWVDSIRLAIEYHTYWLDQINTKPVYATSDTMPVTDSESNRSFLQFPYRLTQREMSTLKNVTKYYYRADDYARILDDKIAELPPSGKYMNSLEKDLLLLRAISAATLQNVQDCFMILRFVHIRVKLEKKNSLRLRSSSMVTYYADSMTEITELLPDPDDEEVDGDLVEEKGPEVIEDQKSVVMHFLSQLKFGMDLTKVTLPTFILERRSLLEMFADFMAHPDLFVLIPTIPDSNGRFLAVLHWYLTSFHSGRLGTIAKKPYNPVLGEVFHCSWRVSDSPEIIVTYTGEQVSHHPPVSAFYVECRKCHMRMNSSIYTKSKFLGMSVGVQMVGKVCLRLEDHNEDYVFGMPSAYARSILTVPWVELGDKIQMTCEKTGCTAQIVFHSKPIYGGKLHHVTAEAKNTRTGDILCKVNGEWNSVFEFTYPGPQSKTVDVKTLKVYKKHVRPMSKQQEYESRKLWLDVTNALKRNEIQKATEYKLTLEETQRDEEQHLQSMNLEHTSKFFKKIDGVWIYKTLPDNFCEGKK